MTALSQTPSAVRLERGQGRAIIRRHSKSFSLASLLLGERARDEAVALYAYCRRVDDAVDLVSAADAVPSVEGLERELDGVYAGRSQPDPVVAEFQRLVFERGIPRAYPAALLQGMRDDAGAVRYETMDDLYRYCWYVAGSVGAMMCHVLGVRRPRAVLDGVHLGMAMQLTNICRDVREDWARGRLYLPAELLPGAPPPGVGPLPITLEGVLRRAVKRLLDEADYFYRRGDEGLRYLPFRSRLAVATARRVYCGIGDVLRARDGDVFAARAYVSAPAKLWHVGNACVASSAVALTAPPFTRAELAHPVRFPEDVLSC